jgi:hypothetical protein
VYELYLGPDQVRRLALAAPIRKLNGSRSEVERVPQEVFYSLIVSSIIAAFWFVAVIMAVIARRRTGRRILQGIVGYLASERPKKE